MSAERNIDELKLDMPHGFSDLIGTAHTFTSPAIPSNSLGNS